MLPFRGQNAGMAVLMGHPHNQLEPRRQDSKPKLNTPVMLQQQISSRGLPAGSQKPIRRVADRSPTRPTLTRHTSDQRTPLQRIDHPVVIPWRVEEPATPAREPTPLRRGGDQAIP